VAGEAEVALPAPADPDDEVDAALALDDEPAIDVTAPPGDAPASAEEAHQQAEQLFRTEEPIEADAPARPAPADETESDRPKRRGWWSR
jgi:ribonuclease E